MMRAYAATSPVGAPLVLVSLDPQEAKELAEDLARAAAVLENEGCMEGDRARVPRLERLAAALLHARSHRPEPAPRAIEDAAINEAIMPAEGVPVPGDHLEWVVRVFHATPTGVQGTMAISRPFPGEARARDFCQRTIAVHRAKVLNREAPAFEVVLGTQDDRKWRKDRGFAVIERQLVTGD